MRWLSAIRLIICVTKDLQLFGWDYLEYVFTDMMRKRHPLLEAGAASGMGKEELEILLAALFSPDENPENTTLDRLAERANFLIELDTFVQDHFDSKLERLVDSTEGKLINGGKGYYELLPKTISFSDPMKKKITFLLKLLEEAGLETISDKQNFIPIMDYHMQRVLLRLGCVEIKDK